jgi:hypothetical protein
MNRPPLLQVALVLIILISLSVSLTPPSGVQATPASGGCWYYKANMSTPRRAMAAVELDSEIYVIGGRNGTYNNLVERYDPAGPSGGSWETLAPMPTPRDLLVAAVAEPQPGDPRIYAIGGRNPLVGYGIVEMYDPGSDTWVARQPMNVARFGAVAGVVNNKIYVIGGWATTEALDTVEAYDPTTDTWTLNFDVNEEFEPVPEPLAFAGAAVVDNKIYVIGGRTNSIDPGNPDPADVLSTVYEFDPSSNTWTRRADIPSPREGEIPGRNRMTTAVVGDNIYMIGGANYPDRWLDTVQVYTPASNSWESLNWMPTRQGELASAVVGDTIYVFGGVRSWDGGTVDYTYAFDVNCSNNPPEPPSDPLPPPGMSGPVDTLLSWSGGDPDDDDVTYDVYFSEAISPTVNTTPVLVSAGQVETTYVPTETLKPLTWYYWRVIAKDSSGAATSGQATMTISDTVTIVDRWGFRTAEGPVIDVEKTADPEFLPESGGLVTFAVKVTNTGTEDVTLTGLVDDPFGNLAGQGTCLTGGTILPSEVYECAFTHNFPGGQTIGEVFVDTVTATAENATGIEARAEASASVEIISAEPSIRVTKSAEPTSVPETGGTVDYTVSVRNVSFTSLTLTGLVDNSGDGDVDLNGQGDCLLPVEMASLESYQCTFSMTISGNAYTEHTNTVTATATFDSNSITDSAEATVTFTDASPEVEVTKSANPTSVNEPGGKVAYTVVVTNPGQEPFTLTSLEDNRFGDLDGQGSCATTGLTLEAGEDYQCKFYRDLFGVEGEEHTNRVTVKVVDDELNEVSASSADVTVKFTKGVFNRFLYLPLVLKSYSPTAPE